jgi:AraC family ethanolamine operon transcriptional activator
MDAPEADGRPRGAAIFPAGVVANWAFDDFEAMAASPRAWDQHYLKLTDGPFRGSLDLAHTAGLQIGAASWSSGILATGALPRGARTFAVVSGSGEPARILGKPIRPGQIAATSDRDELNFLHPLGCDLLCFSIAHAILDEAAATFFGEVWQDAVAQAPAITLHDVDRLAAEIRRLLAVAKLGGPARLADPSFGRKLELAAAEALAGQMAGTQPRRVVATERQRLARGAQEYLRANECRSVGIAELCAAVGAPERTLHKAFREYFGLPPVAYLRARRLHHARHQLLERGRATTVTATATDWGFDHLGEFAMAYRRLFGEAPSETLRR